MSIRLSSSILAVTASVLLVSIILSMSTSTSALEYPSPPPVPKKFDSPEDVQRYLNQLHNYYMVVGRPRFGKRSGLVEKNNIYSLLNNRKETAALNNNVEMSGNDYQGENSHESLRQFDSDANDRLMKSKILKYLIHED